MCNLIDTPIDSIEDIFEYCSLYEDKSLMKSVIPALSDKISIQYDIMYKESLGMVFLSDALIPSFMDKFFNGYIEDGFGEGISPEEESGCVIYSININGNQYAFIYDHKGMSVMYNDSSDEELIDDMIELFDFYDNNDIYFIFKNKLKTLR